MYRSSYLSQFTVEDAFVLKVHGIVDKTDHAQGPKTNINKEFKSRKNKKVYLLIHNGKLKVNSRITGRIKEKPPKA
jgi:uncharacterized protein YajQ (UPF0234 family)